MIPFRYVRRGEERTLQTIEWTTAKDGSISSQWVDVPEVVEEPAEAPAPPQVFCAPTHYFSLALVDRDYTGQRKRSNQTFAKWIDAVQALDLPHNRDFDTIDYWDGSRWHESVTIDPCQWPADKVTQSYCAL